MDEHVCNWNNAWPTGHPLPPEIPDKLCGPEVSEVLVYLYGWERQEHRQSRARVIRRSYVWSPGECRSKGGYRHYDWSVVEVTDPDRPAPYTVVVKDTDLAPLKLEDL